MRSFSFYFSAVFVIFFLSECHTMTKKSVAATKRTVINDSIRVKFQLVAYGPELPTEINNPLGNNGYKFITDTRGKIWILKNDSILPNPFFNIYDKIGKQDKNSPIGMIFSVAFHPQYAMNHKFYVCYNTPSKVKTRDAKLIVSEFTASATNPNEANIKSEHRVIEFEGSTVQDNGAEMAFGPDGFLYISLGDDNAGDTTYRYHAQDLRYFNGKLLRIDVDKTPYGIPDDNPFVSVKNAKPEIFAYGFRKLWRFSFDPLSHQIFGGDVGEANEEEIDMVTKGANYGWPAREGDSSFEKNISNFQNGFTSPINTYTHKVGICVIGGSFYYGDKIPQLKNKYVFADWNGSMFSLLKNKSGSWERQPLKIVNKPLTPFFICGCSIDADQNLYVMGYLTDKENKEKGVVYKLDHL